MTITDEISEDSVQEVPNENIQIGKSNYVENNKKSSNLFEITQDYTSDDKRWKVAKGTMIERCLCAPIKSPNGTELRKVKVFKDNENYEERWMPTSLVCTRADIERFASAEIKRKLLLNELIETEEEFIKDIQNVIQIYFKPLETTNPNIPKVIKDNKRIIFGNFKSIAEFHKNILFEAIKYCVQNPSDLGKTFIRLERDFDVYSEYYVNEPKAQEIICSCEDFFKELQNQNKDTKGLSTHLKLPIQRINDYQSILKDLIKLIYLLGEDPVEVERALELVQGIPSKEKDKSFLSALVGYKGSLFKLGKLIAHDKWILTETENKDQERYIFLFKTRLLITKIKSVGEDKTNFEYKSSIKVSDIKLAERPKDSNCIVLKHSEGKEYQISTENQELLDNWLSILTNLCSKSDQQAQSRPVEKRPKTEDQPSLAEKKSERPKTEDQPSLAEKKSERPKTEDQPSLAEKKSEKPKTEEKENLAEKKSERPKTEDQPNLAEKKSEKLKVTEPEKETQPERPKPKKRKSADDQIQILVEEYKPKAEVEPESKNILKLFDNLKETVEASILTLSTDKSKTESYQSTEQSDQGNSSENNNNNNNSNQSGESRENDQNLSSGNDSSENNDNPREPPYLRLPTFFDPPPPIQYVAHLEIQIKKKRKKPPKIIRKLVPTSDDLERRSQLLLSGDYPCERVDYSAASAHRKIRSIKHTFDKSGDNHRFTEDTVEKAKARNFKNIVSPAAVLPVKSKAFDYQYIIEDPKTGLWLSTSEIQNYYSPEELEELITTINSEGSNIYESTESSTVKQSNGTLTTLKPKFEQTIKGQKTAPGENVKFQVQLKDRVSAVEWLKDNKPLGAELAERVVKKDEGNNTYSLEILRCTVKDTGLYTAKAVHGLENSTCTAQLIVDKTLDDDSLSDDSGCAPQFTVELRNTEVIENTFLTFMVKVKGEPKPVVKFLKNDREIMDFDKHCIIKSDHAETGFYELMIKEVTAKDAGTYTCSAYNKFGTAECKAELTVVEERDIFHDLDQSIVPGDKPNFLWRKDNVPFDPEERFKILLGTDDDSLALVFQNVKPDDAGLYTCVAQTVSGNIFCSAELTIQGIVQPTPDPVKPTIIIENKEVNVTINGSAILDCRFEGYPKPNIMWKYKGKTIEANEKYKFLFGDADSMSLVIKNVSIEDMGSYTIEASNDLGEDTAEIGVNVKYPPRVKKPENFECMVNDTLKMSIEIEANPAANAKFYRNGTEITESERVNFTVAGNYYLLKFNKTELSDAGTYSVIASNELSQSSEFWSLTVFSPPVISKSLESQIDVDEKEDIELSIKSDSYPPPTVRWLKDGKPINEHDSRVKVIQDGNTYTLKIHGANRNDSAVYSVELENPHGTTVDQAVVNVKCAPQIIHKLKDITVNEGDTNVDLTVKSDGYPKPKIHWFLDGIEITETRKEFEKKIENDSFVLTIKEATTELQGKYSCKIENSYGSDTCEGFVTVNCKPKITKPLQDVEVDEGNTLTLNLEVYAVPEPQISWYKDGKEISADANIKIQRDSHRSESYSLTLNIVKGSDTGDYECRVANSMGEVTSKSRVIVQAQDHYTKEEHRSYYKEEDTADACSDDGNPELDTFEKERNVMQIETTSLPEIQALIENRNDDDDDYNRKIEALPEIPAEKPDEAEKSSKAEKPSNEEEDDSNAKKDVEDGESKIPPQIKAEKPSIDKKDDIEVKKPEVKPEPKPENLDDKNKTNKKDEKQKSTVDDDQEKPQKDVAPEIISHTLKDISMFDSLPLSYEVNAKGVPKPEVVWLLNGTQVQQDNRVVFTNQENNYKMDIVDVKLQDAGEWRAVVRNRLSEKVLTANLEVIRKFSFKFH
uniref:CSON000837 protein n=1 Tax=Culicoides sonorensis TaxID=179676 RepID=A0A336L6B8_CULSO